VQTFGNFQPRRRASGSIVERVVERVGPGKLASIHFVAENQRAAGGKIKNTIFLPTFFAISFPVSRGLPGTDTDADGNS
jgi:hypothetical protein